MGTDLDLIEKILLGSVLIIIIIGGGIFCIMKHDIDKDLD